MSLPPAENMPSEGISADNYIANQSNMTEENSSNWTMGTSGHTDGNRQSQTAPLSVADDLNQQIHPSYQSPLSVQTSTTVVFSDQSRPFFNALHNSNAHVSLRQACGTDLPNETCTSDRDTVNAAQNSQSFATDPLLDSLLLAGDNSPLFTTDPSYSQSLTTNSFLNYQSLAGDPLLNTHLFATDPSLNYQSLAGDPLLNSHSFAANPLFNSQSLNGDPLLSASGLQNSGSAGVVAGHGDFGSGQVGWENSPSLMPQFQCNPMINDVALPKDLTMRDHSLLTSSLDMSDLYSPRVFPPQNPPTSCGDFGGAAGQSVQDQLIISSSNMVVGSEGGVAVDLTRPPAVPQCNQPPVDMEVSEGGRADSVATRIEHVERDSHIPSSQLPGPQCQQAMQIAEGYGSGLGVGVTVTQPPPQHCATTNNPGGHGATTLAQISPFQYNQPPTTTGDCLEIMRMMTVPLKPSSPAAGLSKEDNHMVLVGSVPPPMETEATTPPVAIPLTPISMQYSPNPPATPMVASVPSLAPPTPSTPRHPDLAGASQNKLFSLKQDVNNSHRICEISVHDGPHCREAACALRFFLWCHHSLTKCLQKPCNLQIAVEDMAKLCEARFDESSAKLQFMIPRDCVLLDEFLRVKKVDLLCGHFLLQQVVNLMAALHSNGHEDRLSLCGSVVVWVAPDRIAHLLVDFPQILIKKERNARNLSFDPRAEDIVAVYELYRKVLLPHINHGSSWVSPGLDERIRCFESLLTHPSNVDSMAKLARILGDRRLCKLEVELMSLTHSVYCVEQELLADALFHVASMVPGTGCDWEVRWAESGGVVDCGVKASAHRCMRFTIQPVYQGLGSSPFSTSGQRGLSFRSSSHNVFQA